jgi:phosphate starvation-inducible PhoH-like protein
MKTSAAIVMIENEMALPSLYGDMDKNLRLIENNYGVILNVRGNRIQIEGEEKAVSRAERLVKQLADMLAQGIITQKEEVNTAIQASSADPSAALKDLFQKTIPVSSRKRAVALKNEAQRKYVEAIRQHDIVFGIGPAGERPILPWPRPSLPCSGGRLAASFWYVRLSKQGRSWVFFPAIFMKRSIPTCGRSTMRCTT